MKKTAILLLAVLLLCSVSVLAADRPDWYPDDVNAFRDFHNDPDTPRVVDDAGVLSDAQEAALEKRITEIRQTYGADLVLFTDTSSYGLGHAVYAADFYQFNGYGIGDDYNGSVLLLCLDPYDRGWWTAACGAYRPYFNETNINWIDDQIEPYLVNGDYGGAFDRYLDAVSYIYEYGQPPRSYTGLALAALVIGLLAALVTVATLDAGMKKVNTAYQAQDYIVPGSFKLRMQRDLFLYTNIVRTPRNSGSNSSGGSSHSGNYSSSGGRSFSGGGRKF